MKFTHEGQEYEFQGEYRHPIKGDRWLNSAGMVEGPAIHMDTNVPIRAIVHPVQREHIFGGVKFVETGEVGNLNQDEYGITSSKTLYHHRTGVYPTSGTKYIKLKPVEVI